jgi:hypothetical protein
MVKRDKIKCEKHFPFFAIFNYIVITVGVASIIFDSVYGLFWAIGTSKPFLDDGPSIMKMLMPNFVLLIFGAIMFCEPIYKKLEHKKL